MSTPIAVAAQLPATPVPAARLLAERIAAVALPPARRRAFRVTDKTRLISDAWICVVTGDRIHEAVAHLDAGDGPARLVWAAHSPRTTYGDALVDRVLAAPCRPTVWDTARFGEPDLLRLAYAAYVSAGATAVVCLTDRRLVRELRSRGIPARGRTAVV